MGNTSKEERAGSRKKKKCQTGKNLKVQPQRHEDTKIISV
jgi:hypothetical protein